MKIRVWLSDLRAAFTAARRARRMFRRPPFSPEPPRRLDAAKRRTP